MSTVISAELFTEDTDEEGGANVGTAEPETAPTTPASLNPSSAADRQHIIDLANKYRRAVNAANMLKISWDPVAADSAQLYANKCLFKPNKDAKTSKCSGEPLKLNCYMFRIVSKWFGFQFPPSTNVAKTLL